MAHGRESRQRVSGTNVEERPPSRPRLAPVPGEDSGVEGETSPFEELVLPLLDDLYRFARRLEADGERAADLLQDALLVACRKFRQLERPDSFRAWMGRIVYRTFLNRRRRRPVEASVDVSGIMCEPTAEIAGPEARLLARRLRAELAAAVDALPVEQRLAVLLVDALEFTYGEAAETLAVAPGTVASRVARGRAALRKALRQAARDRGWSES